MKVIIIASSIFYLLGLKISNNVEVARKHRIAPINKIESTGGNENIFGTTSELNLNSDSLNISGIPNNEEPHYKNEN